MAPTHPKNIELEIKGSRKICLVTGNVMDLDMSSHFRIYFPLFKQRLQGHGQEH